VVSPGYTWANREGGFLAGPIIFPRSVLLALLMLLRTVLPPVVVVALLYSTANAFGIPANDGMNNAAAIAFGVSIVFLQAPRNATNFMSTPSLPIVFSMVTRWGMVFATMLAIGYITKMSDYFPRRLMLTWAALTPAVLIVVMLTLNEILRRIMSDPMHARRTVFVGCNASSVALAQRLSSTPDAGMNLLGFFDDRTAARLVLGESTRLLGRLSTVAQFVKDNNVQVIFISLPIRHAKRFIDLLDELGDTTASIYYVPDIFSFDLIQSHPRDVLGVPVVAMCETPLSGYRAIVKRVMDIVIASVVLLPLAPLLLLLSAIIRFTSAGPVIFRQRRYGLDGHEFVVYKFRTMKVAEDGDVVTQVVQGDARITSIGAFLRRYSLDELPQLVNVLQGRMSLVGPRPHAVAHNEQYRKLIKGYMLRHKVLPGITGLAQVNGCRGETPRLEDMQARVRYDLDYLKRWSPMLDMKILVMTALRAFSDKKAY
jgi:putative colanic acid biosynthesis UDP-glucose lipid carrier transferase